MSQDLTAYEVFTSINNYPACAIVQDLDYSQRCNYVLHAHECQNKEATGINYMKLLYCGFDPTDNFQQFLGVIMMVLISLGMFIILAVSTDRLFCPSLKVVAELFGLSEHLAGITLLAFGNGAPDLFTSVGSMNNPSRFMFSDLFSAGIFVSSVVGGMICLLAPFKMLANNLMRDCCFYIFSCVYIEYALTTNYSVTVYESVGVLSIYFFYVLANFIDQYLLKRHIRHLEAQMVNRKFATEANVRMLEDLLDQAGIDMKRGSRISIDPAITRQQQYDPSKGPNYGLLKQFMESLNPFDKEDWDNGNCIIRALVIIKIPINLVLLFLIPVTDYDMPSHGWSKLLNSMQMVFSPTLMVYLLFPNGLFLDIRMHAWVFIITIPLGFVVFFTSRTDVPPSYHSLYAFVSIMGSITIIYTASGETVQIFYVLGVITTLSNVFLGTTLLAWGNSIGDMVADVSLSRAGYQKMGFAACYGGPLFNTLLAMGIQMLYKSSKSPTGSVKINQGNLGENCYVFLTLILMSTLIWAVSTNFYARRSVGILCFTIYMIFFTYNILGTLQIIDTYAPDVPSGLP